MVSEHVKQVLAEQNYIHLKTNTLNVQDVSINAIQRAPVRLSGGLHPFRPASKRKGQEAAEEYTQGTAGRTTPGDEDILRAPNSETPAVAIHPVLRKPAQDLG